MKKSKKIEKRPKMAVFRAIWGVFGCLNGGKRAVFA
jgi:hypothetical protein